VRTQIDWSTRHGPVMGAVNVVLSGLVAAIAGTAASLPFWYVMPFVTVGGAATVYVGVRRSASRANIIFWWLCWFVPGAWSTATLLFGWSTWGVGVLLAAGLAGGVMSPYIGKYEPAAPAVAAASSSGRLESIWEARITRLCGFKLRVTVPQIIKWDNRSGYDVLVDFPPGSGYTWEDVQAKERELASAANLPKGCRVRAVDADYQGSMILKVTTVNALGQEALYPDDYSPLDVRKPFPIGHLVDREPAMVEIRQSAGLVVGRRGTGKTNILDLFTAALCRMPNAIIWHIDLNGGGMSVPWMLPSVAGLVPEYPIDWVARTPEEALLMTRVALAIAKDRKAAYGALKARHNSRLLPVSPDLPEIVIIVDEGAEVVGEDAEAAAEAARNLRTLQRIGRAEAVNVIFSALRATGDTIPVAVRKQCSLRIGTKVEEDSELDYLFNYDRGLRSGDLLYAGNAYIRTDDMSSAAQMQAWHIKPDQIAEVVLATSHLRPPLDDRAVRVGGRVYAERWERTRPYLTALAGEDGELEVPDVEAPVGQSPDGAGVAVEKLRLLTRQYQEGVKRMIEGRDERDRVRRMSGDEVLAEAESIFALAYEPGDEEPDDQEDAVAADEPEPPADAAARRALVTRFVRENGPVRTKEIIAHVKASGINVHDSAVFEWLKAEREAGRITSLKQGVWTEA
jgi:hypothetical protein